ncbi:MAG TPA: type VI secretion system tube protein TssD [Polyangiaceae bacterium]|nr:type VI secretion system tube protein TssD [Polyangiaceae bacterium]
MKGFFVVTAIAVCLAASVPVDAAEAVALTLMGQKQGAIKGDITQKGREGAIEVLNLELGASSTAGGPRRWDSLKITKRVDVSTINLVQAFTSNETLTKATFKMFRPNASGIEEQFFTVELQNAVIVSDRIKSASVTADGKPDTSAPVEEVSFNFQKIAFTYPSGNKSAQDDWQAR